jgi:lipid A 3-O-deacylase
MRLGLRRRRRRGTLDRLGGLGFCLIAAAAALLSGAARAQDFSWLDEVKFAVLAHDVGFAGGKEGGADINGELLFRSPIDDAMASQITPYLRWMVQPRIHVGFEANTSGFTNQGYFGLTWTWLLLHDLVNPGDGLDFGISFGPSFNDGHIKSSAPDQKSLGANVLFRESFELGYRISPRYEVSLFFDHVSNGGLAKQNQSINDAGVRFGLHF